ncbi:hypothetical protein KEJ14_02085 [Candidatus Bathyarchaeota archaeon]|nr:hypothetical protein [Candidatus Bathyarchaeota archaeon]
MRGILYVKDKMDCSKIETIIIYTKLMFLPNGLRVCRAAETVEDAEKLIETKVRAHMQRKQY